jgi:perosamine synthetase
MIYKQLEKEFAKYVHRKYAVAVNSGTSALHLALIAIGVGPGDEVIVPDLTFVACAFAVSYTGAKPIFVDVKDDYTIDEKQIERKITKKTKAIMAVHLYGNTCYMPEILKIAKQYQLKVIEDCSEHHLVELSESDVACYSFQSSKQIHCEEGGIIVTNKKRIADECSKLKTFYHTKGDYFHKKLSFNYRMPDSQAKLAIESICSFKKTSHTWVYPIICDSLKEKKELIKRGARPFFQPLSIMPMYKQKVGKNALKLSKLGVVIRYEYTK